MSKYQAYPEYKNSEIEWVGDIPEHWVVAELKRYSRVQGGYAFSSDSFVDSGIPVIRIGDIKQDGTISLESCKYIQDEVSTQYKDFEVRSGDLLMAMTGATIGKAGWFKGSQRALLNQRVGSFKCNKSFLNYKFFWYVLNSLGYQEYIRITAFGGAQPNISDTGMVSYQSAIPDLIEQEKIASFLNHETAKIDTLIDKQQQLIRLLKEKRQAVISHAVTKGLNPNAPMRDSGVEWLGEVPEHWCFGELKFYARVVDCKHITAEFFDEGIPLASISEVKGWCVNLATAKLTNEKYYLDLIDGGRKPQTGDIIYSRNATVGEAALVLENMPDFAMGQDVCLIRLIEGYLPEYLLYVLKSGIINNQLDLAMVGSTFKRINVDDIRNFLIPSPLLNEQKNIVKLLGRSLEKHDTLISKAESAIELMQERRTALISAAVTGKIDVRHPVCHPAGDLQSSKSTVHGDL